MKTAGFSAGNGYFARHNSITILIFLPETYSARMQYSFKMNGGTFIVF